MNNRGMQLWIVTVWALSWGSAAQAASATALRGGYSVQSYQIGDVWGRQAVDLDGLAGEDPQVARALMAAGRYRHATAFYLGKFAGQHIMATNHHVQPTSRCGGHAVWFPVLGEAMPCRKVYGTWNQVDVAFFSLKVTPEQEALLQGVGRNFDFDASIYRGQPLLTVGFGIAGNPRQALSLERDDDCVVFSGRDEFRFMADPDKYNPGPYRAWSFAQGCDISHGDSGSPMIDRHDGAILGLLWTGSIPKPEAVQHSDRLRDLLDAPDETVWSELGYAVPAPMIKQHLQSVLQSSRLDAEARQVLAALLEN